MRRPWERALQPMGTANAKTVSGTEIVSVAKAQEVRKYSSTR